MPSKWYIWCHNDLYGCDHIFIEFFFVKYLNINIISTLPRDMKKKKKYSHLRWFHPINWWDKLLKAGFGRGFVNRSAIWFFVEICSMEMVLFTTWERKWCRRIERCLVRGRLRWLVASLMQLMLSSKVRHWMVGVSLWMSNWNCFNSCNKWMMLMTSRRAVDRAMYSASVVLKAIKLCNYRTMKKSHPKKSLKVHPYTIFAPRRNEKRCSLE